MSSNTSNDARQPEQPGLVAGHAQYIKGAAESAIGAAMGSHAWTGSGAQDKASGVATMKAAGEKRDAAAQGYGRVEEVAGKVVGCEGMRGEGERSAAAAAAAAAKRE